MRSICVVGAGVMGQGIAYASAVGGYEVKLNDVCANGLEQAEQSIAATLRKSADKGFLHADEAEEAQRRISYRADLSEAVSGVGLVIEAVFEKLELKIEVFKKLDQLCEGDTILATNTSTMSPTEIGAQTSRPEKCIAMHFLNPVHKMKLIEIVKGMSTSADTVEKVKAVAAQLGKTAIEVNEFPGFVTSRMSCLIGNEAMNMLMEGVASARDIDTAMKLGLNHAMGPLESADLVGLDTRLRNMEYLHQTLGEKYRPCPLLRKYVMAGRLGRKSGMGFYDYAKTKNG
jgi:3-hydroxybutyryl-CoA dehydrogenase